MTIPTKPYFLRALYEWCTDNGFTPHIAVWVNEYTQVPHSYVIDDQIVLNIAPSACHNLHIENDWVSLEARFGGKAEQIWIPVGHIISIFARENGNGMGFDVEPFEGEAADEQGLQIVKSSDTPAEAGQDEAKSSEPSSSFLKIVK